MYIYRVTNLITGESYIGQTKKTPEKRWTQHCYDCQNRDNKFSRAIKKYSPENFKIDILEHLFRHEFHLTNEREKHWIAHFDTCKNGYNSTIGGSNLSHRSKSKFWCYYCPAPNRYQRYRNPLSRK
jgi:group I intron endonuclease